MNLEMTTRNLNHGSALSVCIETTPPKGIYSVASLPRMNLNGQMVKLEDKEDVCSFSSRIPSPAPVEPVLTGRLEKHSIVFCRVIPMLMNGRRIILTLLTAQVGINSKLKAYIISGDLEIFRTLDSCQLICIDRWIYPRIGRWKYKDNDRWLVS